METISNLANTFIQIRKISKNLADFDIKYNFQQNISVNLKSH